LARSRDRFEIVELAPELRDIGPHHARPRRGLGVEMQRVVFELQAREAAAPAGREALHHAHLDHGHVLAVELERVRGQVDRAEACLRIGQLAGRNGAFARGFRLRGEGGAARVARDRERLGFQQ